MKFETCVQNYRQCWLSDKRHCLASGCFAFRLFFPEFFPLNPHQELCSLISLRFGPRLSNCPPFQNHGYHMPLVIHRAHGSLQATKFQAKPHNFPFCCRISRFAWNLTKWPVIGTVDIWHAFVDSLANNIDSSHHPSSTCIDVKLSFPSPVSAASQTVNEV